MIKFCIILILLTLLIGCAVNIGGLEKDEYSCRLTCDKKQMNYYYTDFYNGTTYCYCRIPVKPIK